MQYLEGLRRHFQLAQFLDGDLSAFRRSKGALVR